MVVDLRDVVARLCQLNSRTACGTFLVSFLCSCLLEFFVVLILLADVAVDTI
jgi:hypothetical protein